MNYEKEVADIQVSLLPEQYRPVPLPADFYKAFIDRNPHKGTKLTDLFVLSSSRVHEADIMRAAEEIVGMNEAVINETSRRLAASTLPIPSGPIFHNLVSTSFDEKKIIEDAESNLEKQRQTAAKTLRRDS